MPIVDINSISRIKRSESTFIEPTIGIALPISSDSNKAIFVRDLDSYYSRVGIPNLACKELLSAGYSFKIVPRMKYNEYHKFVRFYNDGYAYPQDRSHVNETEENFGDDPPTLSGSNSLHYGFTFDTNITPKVGDYILLDNNFRTLKIVFGDTDPVPGLQANVRLFVDNLLEWVTPVMEALRRSMGYNVQLISGVIVAYKLSASTFAVYSNVNNLSIEASEYADSVAIDLIRAPILDIQTKYSRYTDDVYIDIKKLYDLNYIITVSCDGKSFEVFNYDSTHYQCEVISLQSEFISMKFYKEGDLPIGRFYLKGLIDSQGELVERTTSLLVGYPHTFITISDDLIQDDNELYLFDRYKDWSDRVVRIGSRGRIGDDWYEAWVIALLNYKQSRLLGIKEDLDEIDIDITDANHLSNNIYSLDMLRLYYYKGGKEVPFLSTIIDRTIWSYVTNNLSSRTSITEEYLISLMSNLQEWISSIKEFNVTKFEQRYDTIDAELSVTINSYNGVTEELNFSFIIRET